MDFINQLVAQARGLFLSMTPGTRVMAIIMVAAIAISSAFLVRDSQQTKMELLFGGHLFKDSELYRAETAMSNAGLRLYQRDGNRIKVPTSERDLYLKALSEGNAVPRDLGSSLEKALSGGNFLEPLTTTKTRILAARQNDIAEAIGKLPFVEHASVSYDERRDGFATRSQSTAAVMVLPKVGFQITDQHKRGIMRLVQSAFAGLKYEDITVMDLSNASEMNGETDPLNSEQQQYYQQKIQVEQDLRRKAVNLLADYGEVRLEVNVELDPTLREESEKLAYADKPVTVQSTTTKKDSEATKTTAGGRPGTEPNALANKSASLSGGGGDSNSKTKEQQESERKIVGKEKTLTAKVGLQVLNATLSVAIPTSYYNVAYRRQWQDLNTDKAISEITPIKPTEYTQLKNDIKDRIQSSLSAILPAPVAGTSGLLRVTVTDYLDMPVEPLPEASLVQTLTAWLATQWQSVAMLGLAAAALMSIRSFAKVGATTDDSAFDNGFGIPLDEATDLDLADLMAANQNAPGVDASGQPIMGGSIEGGGSPDAKRFGNKVPSGSDIRDQLSDMVRDNPDAAATLLKSWIGESN